MGYGFVRRAPPELRKKPHGNSLRKYIKRGHCKTLDEARLHYEYDEDSSEAVKKYRADVTAAKGCQPSWSYGTMPTFLEILIEEQSSEKSLSKEDATALVECYQEKFGFFQGATSCETNIVDQDVAEEWARLCGRFRDGDKKWLKDKKNEACVREYQTEYLPAAKRRKKGSENGPQAFDTKPEFTLRKPTDEEWNGWLCNYNQICHQFEEFVKSCEHGFLVY